MSKPRRQLAPVQLTPNCQCTHLGQERGGDVVGGDACVHHIHTLHQQAGQDAAVDSDAARDSFCSCYTLQAPTHTAVNTTRIEGGVWWW